jgi:hypothetical protein
VRPRAIPAAQEQLHADVAEGEMAVVLALATVAVVSHGEPLIHAVRNGESTADSRFARRVHPLTVHVERIGIRSNDRDVSTE